MLRYWKRFRMFVACALFYALFQTVGAAEMYGILWLSRRRGDDPVTKRKALGVWPGKWMLRWSWFCRKIGGMRVRFVWHPSCTGATGPFIMILNHFGAVDGIVMAEVLWALGLQDSRPVAAMSARKIPLLGRAWEELCVAFVKRGTPWSRNRIRFMAKICDADRANFAIAPEGTIMTREKWNDGEVILPAHDSGFEAAVSELDRPILSLTTHWPDFDPYRLSDMGMLPPGTEMVVEEGRVLPSARGRAKAVLHQEWARKEAWLREMRARSSRT